MILKKKMLTKYLQRVRAPHGMNLKEYATFYSKLLEKYSDSKNLKIISKSGYYSDGGYWLIERRMETSAELAKRQKAYDIRIAKRKAQTERYRAVRQAQIAAERESNKRHKLAMKKAQMERKVEEVQTMVKILQTAGYTISATKAKALARN